MDEHDQNLWRSFTKDIKPLSKIKKVSVDSGAYIKKKSTRGVSERVVMAASPKNKHDLPDRGGGKSARQIDKNTQAKLRTGKMQIEARLDLHGFTLKEAQEDLTRKLFNFHDRGFRYILVITGQGSVKNKENDDAWWESKPGKLRREVPEWLSIPPLGDIVLQFHTARQKDGGAGALYVLLRRIKGSNTKI